MDIQENGQKTLKSKIILEYVYVILTFLILYFLLPFLSDYIVNNDTVIDGIGQALALVLIFRILKYIITFIVFIINPIWILIKYKNKFKFVVQKEKKTIYIIVTILPVLFSMLMLLEIPISNLIYKSKYETGKNSYSLTKNEYKTPKDFQDELEKRGFIYNSNLELSRLNSKYPNINENNSKYYYENASLMPLFSQLDYFADTKDYNNIIDFNSNIKAPVYIYNTILYLYDKNEELKYAPISRYNGHTSLIGTHYPYFEDYYIELKILYVNEDVYAIIGVGQSYDIEKYFIDKKEDNKYFYTYPYNMIISEKDTITTYFNKKYYPEGAIENKGNKFEMTPNTNKKEGSEFYKVRKVNKLDVYTINEIAKELQNGILKESIESHFNK